MQSLERDLQKRFGPSSRSLSPPRRLDDACFLFPAVPSLSLYNLGDGGFTYELDWIGDGDPRIHELSTIPSSLADHLDWELVPRRVLPGRTRYALRFLCRNGARRLAPVLADNPRLEIHLVTSARNGRIRLVVFWHGALVRIEPERIDFGTLGFFSDHRLEIPGPGWRLQALGQSIDLGEAAGSVLLSLPDGSYRLVGPGNAERTFHCNRHSREILVANPHPHPVRVEFAPPAPYLAVLPQTLLIAARRSERARVYVHPERLDEPGDFAFEIGVHQTLLTEGGPQQEQYLDSPPALRLAVAGTARASGCVFEPQRTHIDLGERQVAGGRIPLPVPYRMVGRGSLEVKIEVRTGDGEPVAPAISGITGIPDGPLTLRCDAAATGNLELGIDPKAYLESPAPNPVLHIETDAPLVNKRRFLLPLRLSVHTFLLEFNRVAMQAFGGQEVYYPLRVYRTDPLRPVDLEIEEIDLPRQAAVRGVRVVTDPPDRRLASVVREAGRISRRFRERFGQGRSHACLALDYRQAQPAAPILEEITIQLRDRRTGNRQQLYIEIELAPTSSFLANPSLGRAAGPGRGAPPDTERYFLEFDIVNDQDVAIGVKGVEAWFLDAGAEPSRMDATGAVGPGQSRRLRVPVVRRRLRGLTRMLRSLGGRKGTVRVRVHTDHDSGLVIAADFGV